MPARVSPEQHARPPVAARPAGGAISRGGLARAVTAALLAAACAAPATAVAQTIRTWNATVGTWDNAANWQGGVAGSGNIAYFSGPAVGGSATDIMLTVDASVLGLSFASSGSTGFRSGISSSRYLSISSGGVSIASGAGAVGFDTAVTGSAFRVRLVTSQTWTNNSANTFTTGDVYINSTGTRSLTIDGTGNTWINAGNNGFGVESGTTAIASQTLSLVKNGSGQLTLGSAGAGGGYRFFNGGLTINSGTVLVAHTNALGTGTVTMNGGGFDVSSGITVLTNSNAMIWAGEFTFGGGSALNTRNIATLSGTSPRVTISANSLTVAAIAEATAGLGFAKDGPGTLIVSGVPAVASTYTGSTSILAGTLQIGIGGTTGDLRSSGTFAISSGGRLSFNRLDDYGGAYAGRIMGSGSIRLASGTLALSNAANSYSGGSVLNGGVLRFDSPTALGTGDVTFSGTAGAGLLRSNASGTLPNGLVFNATGTFDSQSNNNTIAGSVTGTGSFVKTGTGSLTLAGANSYTGMTSVNAGLLLLSTTSAVTVTATAARPYVVSGSATLATGFAVDQTFLLRTATNSTGVIALGADSSNALDFSAADLKSMSLGAIGSGTQTYSGALTQTGSYRLGGGGGTLNVASLLSGTNTVLIGGGTAGTGGTVILSNPANSFTGSLNVNRGTLEVESLTNRGIAGVLGSGTTINLGAGTFAGTLRYTGNGHSTDRVVNLAGSAGGGGILDASGSGTVSFLGGVTGNAGTTLTLMGSNTGANYITAITGSNVMKTGVGTWVLGSNSFTGQLVVQQGTIVAAMDAPGGSGTSSSLGKRSGPIPVVGLADATGTAALLAANGVTISRVIEVAALGTGDQEVVLGGSGAGEATFDANSAFRLGRGVTLAADPGGNVRFWTPTANWDQQDGSADPTVAVTIGTPAATGTVTLETTLPNSLTAVTVRQGTLRLGNGTTVGALGPASVLTGSAGATLAFNRSNTINSGVDFAATIGGAMNVTQLGSGTVVLAGVNTYTGTTSIAAGAIRVSGSGRIADSARIDVATGGRLEFARTDDYGGAYDGKLTGSGLMSVQSGSLTLTGLNTFTGSSQVLSGAVLQLDGQINNTSLDVAGGATLMGSGTILGTTTIAGLHRPGNSPGIQTLGNLAYLSGASVQWELWSNTTLNTATPPDYDQVMLTGNLDFAGATTFNLLFTGSAGPTNFSEVAWANSFWDSNREWLVYDVAGTTTGFGSLSLVQTNWLDSTGADFNTARSMASFRLEKRPSNDVYLVYSSIPEPGSLALAGIGLVAAAAVQRRLRRRRRNRRQS